jgi:hypothetical protein
MSSYTTTDFERGMDVGRQVEAARLTAENAKLVDVLHEVETEAVYAFQCLQQDCMTATNSSEHYFEKWWHADCECERLNAENAKLRELASHLWYVKPRGVTSVLVEGKLVDLEELMESVGLRWEDA